MDKNCPRRSFRCRRYVNYNEDAIHFAFVQRSIVKYWYERQQFRRKMSQMSRMSHPRPKLIKVESDNCGYGGEFGEKGLIIKDDDDSKSHLPSQTHGNGNQIITNDRPQSSGPIESTCSMDSSEQVSDC